MDYQIIQSAKDVQEWPSNCDTNPFHQQNFYTDVELENCASEEKGWIANHIQSNDFLIPAYIKSHSWGEYVFDQSWANTYQHYGYSYFPKLVAAIPFTPVTNSKIIGKQDYQLGFECLTETTEQQQLSGWHMLFCPQQQQLPTNVFERLGVQFHWFNQGYSNFDDFLSTFSSRKRKNTRKERQSIADQGVTITQLTGNQISSQQLDFFYLCYQVTYLRRGHQPHLSKLFFEQIIQQIGNQVLLALASKEGEYVAASWFFFDDKNLYGRYWGCTEEVNNLHFELCYYQGIEFAISRGINCFNPGTQGEHKIQRGFNPTFVYSYHWLANEAFRPAISNFCREEQNYMKDYFNSCNKALPFKNRS